MCVVVHNQSSYSIEPYVPFGVIQSKWFFFFTTPCFDRGGQFCFLDVVLCQQQFFLFIVVFYCSVLMLTHTVVISQKKGAKQKKIVLESGSAQLYPKFYPGEKWYLEEYLVVLGLNSTKHKYYKIFFIWNNDQHRGDSENLLWCCTTFFNSDILCM